MQRLPIQTRRGYNELSRELCGVSPGLTIAALSAGLKSCMGAWNEGRVPMAWEAGG